MVIILKCLESVFFFLIVYFSKNLPKPKERNLTSFSNLKRISKDLRFLKNIFFRCLAVSQKGGLLSLPPFHESIGRAFPFCQTQSERTGVGRAPYLGELFLQLWVCILLVTMRKCSFLQKKKKRRRRRRRSSFLPSSESHCTIATEQDTISLLLRHCKLKISGKKINVKTN